ncbi:hypothetical protein BDZ97DRAFT_2072846 [Flammula alnicola]|nr:hypothetical protein BDZ97DRAFT_2072846 [Flammula alnicola]
MRPVSIVFPLAILATSRAFTVEQRSGSEKILARQVAPDPDPTCSITCAPVTSLTQTCTTVACLCTNTVEQNIQSCVNCLSAHEGEAPSIAGDVTTIVTDFNSQCSTFNVGSVTLPVGAAPANTGIAGSGGGGSNFGGPTATVSAMQSLGGGPSATVTAGPAQTPSGGSFNTGSGTTTSTSNSTSNNNGPNAQSGPSVQKSGSIAKKLSSATFVNGIGLMGAINLIMSVIS